MKRGTTPKDAVARSHRARQTLVAGVPSAGKTLLEGKVVPARQPAKDR
jgi:hypothetical protein